VSRWARYTDVRPDEALAIREQTPVAYLPWGALEWHGPHNPLGLDGLKAQAVAERAAAQTGGVVLPPIWIGTGTMRAALPAVPGLEHSAALVELTLREVATGLHQEWWSTVVVVAGHCGDDHMAALHRCADRVTSGTVAVIADWESSDGAYDRDHAALGETALMLATDAGLVDLTSLPPQGELTVPEHGVWGHDPRAATVTLGETFLAATADGLAVRMQTLLLQAG
jgi:creatinine amidohydrolase